MNIEELAAIQKMHRIRLFFLVMAVGPYLGACSQTGVDVDADKATLVERGSALLAAEAARDLEAVMSYWSDEAILQINGAPQVEGKESVRELMRGMLSSFKALEGSTSHIEVSASGDMAYEYGINRVVLSGEDTDLLAMGKYLVVWKKVKGTWLISAISITNDEPAPVPMVGQE